MSANECLLDFPHTPVWCDYHYKEQMEGQVLIELRRSNDLKQREIELSERQLPFTFDPPPRPPRPINPAPRTENITYTGGMSLEPPRTT